MADTKEQEAGTAYTIVLKGDLMRRLNGLIKEESEAIDNKITFF